MRYAIVGGDLRFAHLARMLRENGREAVGFLHETAGGDALPLAELKNYDFVIANWPMRWPLSGQEVTEEEILHNISAGSTMLLCGPKFPDEHRADLRYFDLWKDPLLLKENAWLTAEAAVGSAMARLQTAITGLKCMVVGYGRIGRALTEILTGLNAQVTVMTGSASKLSLVEAAGADGSLYSDMQRCLPGQKLIFSTPPALMIDAFKLKMVDSDALIIDLASPPFGVDMEAAQMMGLHVVRESGLPGRWCPLSAARAIYNAVVRWEEKKNV